MNTIFVLPSTTRCRVQFIRFTSCKTSHNTYVRYVSVSCLTPPLPAEGSSSSGSHPAKHHTTDTSEMSVFYFTHPLPAAGSSSSGSHPAKRHTKHTSEMSVFCLTPPLQFIKFTSEKHLTAGTSEMSQFPVSHLHYSSSSLRLKNVTQQVRQRCLNFLE